MKYNTTNNNQESRRISTVVSDYMNSNTSGNTVQPKTTDMSAEDLDEMVDVVMEDYTDDDGNVNPREIIKDSIQSGVEKVEQRIENHYLANLVKHLNASAKKRSMIYTLLIVLLVICTSIAIFFGTKGTMVTGTEQVKNQLNEGTATLEDAINNTQETLIQMDDQGHPLVLDRKTGLVTSSRVVGDPFIADTRFVSGRKLKCLDIGSVGSLFNDAKTRTPSSVTFMNEDGLEEKVVPLDSYYEDNDDSLFFGGPHGGITILMNTDICNTVVSDIPQDDPQDMPTLGDMPLPDMPLPDNNLPDDMPPADMPPLGDPQDIQGELEVVDNATEMNEEKMEDAELMDVKYEMDIQPALDEALNEMKDSSDTDLFKRGLRDESTSLSVYPMSQGPQGIARVPPVRSIKSESTRRAQDQDVKAHLREMYALAKTVSIDRRKLNGGTSVVICDIDGTDSDGSVGDLVADSSGNLLLNGRPIDSSLAKSSNTLGTAYDAVTIINNVDQLIIPEGATVYAVGTVKIYSRRAVIDGTLNGNGGGYPGGQSPLDTNGHGKNGMFVPGGGVTGGGGGSHAGSGGRGGQESYSSNDPFCSDLTTCPGFSSFSQFTGCCNTGGKPGNTLLTLRPGSGGGKGAGNVAGGAGGAAMVFYSQEIVLNGNIFANGSNGGRGPDDGNIFGGGGGGSGGSIRFSSCTLAAGSSAKIEAKGGSGGQGENYGYGGGGGGGGAFLYEAITINYDDSMSIDVSGGARGQGATTSSSRYGFAGSVGKVYVNPPTPCKWVSDCGSNELCYNWKGGDNKCYTSNLHPGEYCAADSGVELSARCASGICSSSDKKCHCTNDDHCPGEFQRCDTTSNTCKQVCSSGVVGMIPSDVDGIYCCASSCGRCGGSNCSGRPGGASACCSSRLTGRTCNGPFDDKCTIKGPGNNPYRHVQNNDFELGKAAWTRYTSGGRNGYTVDTVYKNSGLQSIKVTNGGANQWIPLDAPAGSIITISGFCKAVGTSTGHPRVEASVYSADGTKLYGRQARFRGGTHDWEFSEYSFTVPKVVNGILLYALYRDDPARGTAYFDDLAVTVKPNMVVNGGFEGNVYASWTRYTSGGRNGYTVNTPFKHSGSQSIRVTNGGANKWIQLDAQAGSTITISGFCKAVGTSTGFPRVEASVYYADGTKLYGRQARFRGGTHDWEFSEYSFTVPKAVRGIILYALYRDDPAQGTAYFDDLAVFVETP